MSCGYFNLPRRTSSIWYRCIADTLHGVFNCHTRTSRWLSTTKRNSRYDVETWESASLPIQQANTIPASWYTDVQMLELEHSLVFRKCWQILGHGDRLRHVGDYFTGSLAPGVPFLVCKDQQTEVRAFHNVCRHHAALVASGSGNSASCFRCPYHGWTYGLDGRLQKAVGLRGIEGFRAADNGLVPLEVASLGPWLFAACGQAGEGHSPSVLHRWLGQAGADALLSSGACRGGMVHVAQRIYTIRCNWKVFCDNYLDGGYHVPVAHPDLASGLNLGTYTSTLYEKLSIQSCEARGQDERLAGNSKAAYIFVFPNLMINSYGPWVDTNVVYPMGPNECQVVFDYYVEAKYSQDEHFIDTSLRASEKVQQEDIELCESVQKGLTSPTYNSGRFVPRFEAPMFHFHQLLQGQLKITENV